MLLSVLRAGRATIDRSGLRTAGSKLSLVMRLIGILSAVGCLSLWVVFLWFNPYARSYQPASHLIAFAMVSLWLLCAIFAVQRRFRWQLVLSVVAFVPIGFYLLLTPGIFSWIGLLNLVYLGVTMVDFLKRPRREEPESAEEEPVPKIRR